MIGISVFGADVGYDGSINIELSVTIYGPVWGFLLVVTGVSIPVIMYHLRQQGIS